MSNDAAVGQHEIIGIKQDIDYTGGEYSKWFSTSKLGLFIHWGISTVHGDVDLSWGMMANKPWEIKQGYDKAITPREYFSLAERFKPDSFSIDKTLNLAKKAGFTYAVFTTKHHDGFALWPSNYGSFNTKKYQEGRDFVQEYVQACRKSGLRVGLYYSPPDWYFNREYMSFNYGGRDPKINLPLTDFDIDHKPTVLKQRSREFMDAYKEYTKNQIIELMTNYGKIDMLWFDGDAGISDCIEQEEIRALQPDILLNPRLHGKGDFQTFECKMPDKKPEGLWEHEDIWAEGPWWAYMETVKNKYRPVSEILEVYNKIKEWNGNFLINIGLKADGSLPQTAEQRIEELGENL